MKKYNTYLFILCWLLPVTSFAQQEDITGMWYGQITIIDTQTVSLPYEIAVSEEKGKLIGYSRIVFHANGKDEAGVQNISIRREGNKIIMEDEGFIEHNFSVNPTKRVKKTMIVVLTTTDSEMILEGSWSTNSTRTYRAYKGVVLLKRKIDFKKLELFKSLDTLNLVSKLSFKDRPETVAVVAVAKPAEKKPEPLSVVSVPAAKISPPSKQKELQMDSLAKSNMKPVAKPASVAPKPGPVEIFAVAPKQEQKTPPSPKPEPEKKPVVVAVEQQPKPVPPVTIVAPSIVKGAAEIEKRVTKSDQSFYFETDSLLLTLYDNGEVDGDTVTVLMNGNIIFSKVGLTTKANSKTIYIATNMDSVKLVMYAESLGEYPPNTGLMVVTDGKKQYDVRFSADLKTNSAIVFRRKRKG
jgi:hypothetical protein